ncbi:inositol monophosphatase family protein [Candidatus Mycalebacterium sp.]
MSFEKETAVALRAVARACAVCAAAQKAGFEKNKKSDGTPVTTADYAAQFVLIEEIAKHFPADEIVAEESPPGTCAKNISALADSGTDGLLEDILKLIPGTGAGEFMETVGRGNADAKSERFWALDPIDGTAGFINLGQFAVAAALVENGRPVLGMLGCPGLGFIMFSAPDGVRKARIDGSRTEPVSAPERSAGKIVFCETARGTPEAYALTEKIMSGTGARTQSVKMDAQCKYALVAGGEADAYLRVPNPDGRRENIWDHAAGAAIVECAGGRVCDFDGRKFCFSQGRTFERNRGVVAATDGVYGKVMEAIQKAVA